MKYRDLARKSLANFDLEEFFLRSNNYNDDYGGCLLITPKQSLLALNGGDGRGVHHTTFAYLMSEIFNIPLDNLAPMQIIKCRGYENMIHARLVNDTSSCGMYFTMHKVDKISVEEYNSFVKFYNEYNDRIRKLSERLNKNLVMYGIGQEDGESKDLTPILEILKKMVDVNKKDANEEIIDTVEVDKHAIYKESIIAEYKYLLGRYNYFIKNDMIEDDYSKYKNAIEKIEKEILSKANDKYTLDEKRELIIEMSIVLDEMNKYLLQNDSIIGVVNNYYNLEKNKNTISNEEYNLGLNRIIKEYGMKFIIFALEMVIKKKNINNPLIDDNKLAFAREKLNELKDVKKSSLAI